MGKTFATKKKILMLLKAKDMTASELASELGLSTATIIQHMGELSRMGAVEKLENEHFRKLKYYHISGNAESHLFRYGFIVLALAALMSVSYLYLSSSNSTSGIRTVLPVNANSPSNQPAAASNSTLLNTTNSIAQGKPNPVPSPGIPNTGSTLACPMISYNSNGTITGYSNFSMHYINPSGTEIADYLINVGSVGVLNLTEKFTDVLSNPENANRTHYYILTSPSGQFVNAASQVNITFSPQHYSAIQNSTISFKAYIRAINASGHTFQLRIDGPCGGGTPQVLITVGSKPYNGTISSTATPYG